MRKRRWKQDVCRTEDKQPDLLTFAMMPNNSFPARFTLDAVFFDIGLRCGKNIKKWCD